MGATAIVIRANEIQFALSTSPIQYSQMVCFAICFRRRTVGVIRNTPVTLLSIITVGIYDLELLHQLYVHYAGGFFAGLMIFVIAEDRMYKNISTGNLLIVRGREFT